MTKTLKTHLQQLADKYENITYEQIKNQVNTDIKNLLSIKPDSLEDILKELELIQEK